MENNAKAKVSSVGIAKVVENVSNIVEIVYFSLFNVYIKQQSNEINPKLRVSNERKIP